MTVLLPKQRCLSLSPLLPHMRTGRIYSDVSTTRPAAPSAAAPLSVSDLLVSRLAPCLLSPVLPSLDRMSPTRRISRRTVQTKLNGYGSVLSGLAAVRTRLYQFRVRLVQSGRVLPDHSYWVCLFRPSRAMGRQSSTYEFTWSDMEMVSLPP